MNLLSTSLGLALLAGLSVATPAWCGEPLQLEAKIPLGDVSGRIDHFGYDAKRQR